MMARGHLISGAVAGVGVAGGLAHLDAPVLVRLAAVVITTACVTLPDIDTRRATIVRVLGPLGVALHHLTVWVGVALYRATATRWDDDVPDDGHRLISHTLVAAAGTAIVVAVGTAAPGIVLVEVSTTWGQPWGSWAAAIGDGWGTVIGDYWWAWGLAAGTGHAAGVLGDTLTVMGAPIWWPIPIHGKRWWRVRSIVPFRAGGKVETKVVYPLLYVALGASVIGVLGWWPPLGRAAVEFVEALG